MTETEGDSQSALQGKNVDQWLRLVEHTYYITIRIPLKTTMKLFRDLFSPEKTHCFSARPFLINSHRGACEDGLHTPLMSQL